MTARLLTYLTCILFVLLLPISVLAQELIQIPLLSPGIRGMISTPGASEIPQGAMRYSLNVDMYTRPGILQKRLGLQSYGPTHYYLYGAAPYYNPYDDHRLIVGVHESTFVWFDTASPPTAYPSLVGHFFVSDTFATNPDNGVAGLVFPYRNAYHDWLPWRDMLFHCDGKSMPVIITTTQTFQRDTISFDTLGFEPRAISLGLEAPGQLRVGLTDQAGPLSGSYKYSYAFYDTASDIASKMARFSGVVYPRNETPYLTQFEKTQNVDSVAWKLILRQKQDASSKWFVIDTLRTGSVDAYGTVKLLGIHGRGGYLDYAAHKNYLYWVVIISDTLTGNPRARDSASYLTAEFGQERLPDVAAELADSINDMAVMSDSVVANAGGGTVSVSNILPALHYTLIADTGITVTSVVDSANITSLGTPLVYLDNTHDSLATIEWFPDSATAAPPGGLFNVAYTQSGSALATPADSAHAYIDGIYNIAYSYYDPTTGLESPLGPALYVKLTDSVVTGGTDSIRYLSFTTGWPATGRPQWIRWYQGVVQTNLTGGGDTTIWYGLFQQRTNDSARTAILGNWTDLSVVTGLDTSTITVVAGGKTVLYDYQLFVDLNGDPIQRPPYSYDLQIPFTDMERAHNRIYGIGDPLCPTCLYYTPVDTISWSPIDFFEIQLLGGDELVAIEELGGILYLFAHNSFWFLPGFNAEIETPFGRIVDNDAVIWEAESFIGVISRETVVKYRGAIYFLNSEGELYVLDDQGPRIISSPVQRSIDTMFVDYTDMQRHANLVGVDNTIKLVHDSTGLVLSMHIPSQTWGHETFTLNLTTGFAPTRMFVYDSTQGSHDISEVLFANGVGQFMRQYRNGRRWDLGNISWAAEFPVLGDGLNTYRVNRLDLRMEFSSDVTLWAAVYDGAGNLISTPQSIPIGVAGGGFDKRFLRWHIDPEQADTNGYPVMFPFVRLYGTDNIVLGLRNDLKIETIVITAEKSGEYETQ